MITPPDPPWHARVRVAFVLFHVLAVALLSIPAPFGARDASTWSDPNTVSQIAAWVGPLRALGVNTSAAELTARVRGAAVTLLEARAAITAPFRPYAAALGTGQGWQMFATLNEEPARLEIDVRRGSTAPWTPVYRARDPQYTWRLALMEEERTRTVINDWSWARNRGSFLAFGKRIAQDLASDFPDASEARLVMLRARLPEPEDLRVGKKPPERETWEQVIALRGARP